VPLAAKTAEAVASYLRARRGHKLAQTEALWLGQAATGLGYQGAVRVLDATYF
jgi:integrase/recombinase XerD